MKSSIIKGLSIEQTAKMSGCSVDAVKKQYLSNAIGLEKLHKKSVSTGKKVNGYTAAQLQGLVEHYYKMAS